MTISIFILDSIDEFSKIKSGELSCGISELKFSSAGEHRSYLAAVELISSMGSKAPFEITDTNSGISIRNQDTNEFHSVTVANDFERIAYRRGIIDTRAAQSIQVITQDNPIHAMITRLFFEKVEHPDQPLPVAA